ncbi:MAG: aquaporin, partial [Pseudopedobacter sp.]|nr:aquaporin [Deinococcales bacterium]
PALFSGNWNGHWIMWLGPVLGALLGAWTGIFLQVKPLEGEIQTSS